jgi:hypothetical protein
LRDHIHEILQAVTNLFKLLDRHPDLLEELKSA